MNKVFLSYSRKDASWVNRFYAHLRPLAATMEFELRTSADIGPGEHWRSATEKAIDSATVAVVLISPNYLASSSLVNEELPRLLEKAKSKSMPVLSFIIAPAALPQDLANSQILNQGRPPLSELPVPEQENQLALAATKVRECASPHPPGPAGYHNPDPFAHAFGHAAGVTGVSGSMNISGSANIFADGEKKLQEGPKNDDE